MSTPATPIRTIVVVDHEPRWRLDFQEIAGVIAATLGDLHSRIEHVGSTSVPGLPAKPKIDFDVVIRSIELLPEVITALAPLGYDHEGERGIPGRHSFRRKDITVPRDASGRSWPSHSLYVCPADSPELERHIRFRAYLRANPDQASAYAAVKRALAARFPHDINSYCDGKSEFIEGALRRAMEN